jgi:hypothetical protein
MVELHLLFAKPYAIVFEKNNVIETKKYGFGMI